VDPIIVVLDYIEYAYQVKKNIDQPPFFLEAGHRSSVRSATVGRRRVATRNEAMLGFCNSL